MKPLRSVIWVLLCTMLFCGFGASADAEPESPKAAFIREGHLWVKQGGEERQLTSEGRASSPKWSHDGEFIAYTEGEEEQRELRIYSLRSNKQLSVYRGAGYHYEWAPNRNTIAFQIDRVLNTSEVGPDGADAFVNVSLGVGNFSWLPDGSGFLVSSDAQLLPTGWTGVKLYKVPADAKLDRKKMKLLFSLPPESNDFFAVATSQFKWSPDRKWIAFIAEPTASWSADSNTLCLLSSDARVFHTAGHMLRNEEWFKWAPKRSELGYIEGEGRVATQNKRLRIKALPSFLPQSYTPKGYVDRGLTWVDDRTVIVSRSVESEWNNDPKLRPLPSLYRIDTSVKGAEGHVQSQVKLTSPPVNTGDFSPQYLPRSGRLTWIRSDREHGEVWTARVDGSDAERYISRIGGGSGYYESWSWESVLAWYEPAVSARSTAAKIAEETVPPYAKWGRLAMQETANRYKEARIQDYRYIGRSKPGAGITEEQFKLWLVQNGREFGVNVHIRFETSTEKVISIRFRESAH
ncbi:DUF3889 domain-containing protein [Paenibacillus allorhizosphaerae]|uniref:Translocation protein TolB n=1 Tax=Paenibacillus allorhizosphaerae TaxID=2849866 RepID=A0ABM8VHT6_9BACL|nr:DUF3889 domain-containing protein [Paenibacillus allorhizosphaerae]CAG7642726.1 hypothetical protein PAECIP111802_02894 [Paenibacillus allorhizosphaerae]